MSTVRMAPFCSRCWAEENPFQQPFRRTDPTAEVCTKCGTRTWSGIYMEKTIVDAFHPSLVNDALMKPEDAEIVQWVLDVFEKNGLLYADLGGKRVATELVVNEYKMSRRLRNETNIVSVPEDDNEGE